MTCEHYSISAVEAMDASSILLDEILSVEDFKFSRPCEAHSKKGYEIFSITRDRFMIN